MHSNSRNGKSCTSFSDVICVWFTNRNSSDFSYSAPLKLASGQSFRLRVLRAFRLIVSGSFDILELSPLIVTSIVRESSSFIDVIEVFLKLILSR